MIGIADLGNFNRFANGSNGKNPQKRAKNSNTPDMDKFKPGYILKVKVRNFTTYSYAEFNLSPTLNMIIGPNGTGKSTLVAAICLGLGGKLDLIKRKNMKSMIKSGHTQGSIEITLVNKASNPPICIKRTFTEKENSYTVNNRSSTEKAVKEICKSLNIQLDNLCHFLPQERVAEFAGLSPEKLLLETERTLGDGSLLQMHEDLIKKDNESHDLGIRITDISSKLDKLADEKSVLEEEAKKYSEYQAIIKDLKRHTMLIPYAQLSDLKERQKHIKKKRDEAKAELYNFKMNLKPIEDQVEHANTAVDEAESKLSLLKDKRKEISSRFENGQLDLATVYQEINQLKRSATITLNKSAQKKAELEKVKQERQALIEDRDSITIPDEHQISLIDQSIETKHDESRTISSLIEQLDDNLTRIKNTMKNLSKEIEENLTKLSSNDRIVVMKPTKNNPYQLKDDSYKAHLILREKPELSDIYYEAPVVCCEVTNQGYASSLEKVIDNNTLFAITVPDKNTFELISSTDFRGSNVPIRMTDINSVHRPNIPSDQLKRLGFDGYLSEFIKGPKPVLCMLYDTARIHNIPVCKDSLSDKQIQKLITPNQQGQILFTKFIAGDTVFNIQKSRYGQKQVFYTTEKIRNANFFSSTALTPEVRNDYINLIEDLKKELETAKTSYTSQQLEYDINWTKKKLLETELNQWKSQRDKIKQLRKSRANAEGKLKANEESIDKLESESNKDYSDKVQQIRNKIKSKYVSTSKINSGLAGYTAELTQIEISLNLQEFEVLQVQNREINGKKLVGFLNQRTQELIVKYQEAKARYDEIKNSDAATQIREQSKNYPDEERRELSELAKIYVEGGNFTEVMIREKMKLLEDQKAVMSTADQSSIENLKRKLDEIQRAERDLPLLKKNQRELDERITKIRDEWEPKLTGLVQEISLMFNKRFTKVASDGQVELAKNERFSDWKLQILVKFRQESELKVLDRQSQSGGERAVSTIFFIMSLQGLTVAPFRVVDEINQGMDPKNEKLAHRYLVHTACQNNNSQYFLVTPKLLTGLYYHPDMVVHCIYTGPLIDPIEKESKDPDFMDFVRKEIST